MPTTPNMNLSLPTVSTTVGPAWASQLNSAIGTAGDGIDGHDHTSGKGVPVPPSGIDITSALTFQNQDATNLRSTRFYSQSEAFSDATDVGCCYVLDADLYYIDTAGNSIRITENGAISSASFGGISGLSAPASAAFSVDTFTFKSDTNKYATMATGTLLIRKSGETSPNFIQVQPPASLASSYAITLPPAIPAAASFVTMDNGGAMATSIATSQGITRAMQAAVGQQVSSVATQTVSAPAGAWTSVTNAVIASMSITGRPVMLTCIADPALGTSSGAYFQAELSYTDYGAGLGAISGSTIGMRVSITGSATTTVGQTILQQQFSVPSAITAPLSTYTVYPPGAFSTVYVPAGAGTFTFQLQLYGSGTLDVSCANIRLLAYEL